MKIESFDQYNAGDTGWTFGGGQWRQADNLDGQLLITADAIRGTRSLSLRKTLGTDNARYYMDFDTPGYRALLSFTIRASEDNITPWDQGIGFETENGNRIVFTRVSNAWIIWGDPDFGGDQLTFSEGPALEPRTFSLCLENFGPYFTVAVVDETGETVLFRRVNASLGNYARVFVGNPSDDPTPVIDGTLVVDNIIADIGDGEIYRVPVNARVSNLLPAAPEDVSAEIYSQNGDYTEAWEILARPGPGPNDMVRTATPGLGCQCSIGLIPDGFAGRIFMVNVITRANQTAGESISPFLDLWGTRYSDVKPVQSYGTFINLPFVNNPATGFEWGSSAEITDYDNKFGFNL